MIFTTLGILIRTSLAKQLQSNNVSLWLACLENIAFILYVTAKFSVQGYSITFSQKIRVLTGHRCKPQLKKIFHC